MLSVSKLKVTLLKGETYTSLCSPSHGLVMQDQQITCNVSVSDLSDIGPVVLDYSFCGLPGIASQDGMIYS
jgi:hypothetical protein